MEVRDYCTDMRGEIITWKAKIFDLMRTMDKRFSASDTRSNSIKVLGDMVKDIEEKIDNLEAECPSDWSDVKADIDQVVNDMNKIWTESVELSPDDF